nr:MAG TPA: hypothetical protein [Caudoviricetes sp.]
MQYLKELTELIFHQSPKGEKKHERRCSHFMENASTL